MSEGSRADDPGRGRALRITDALILVAALGVGLAWSANVLRQGHLDPDTSGWGSQRYESWKSFRYVASGPVLAGLSLGALALRLRRPRPGLVAIARQPGFWAGVAPWLVLVAAYSVGFERPQGPNRYVPSVAPGDVSRHLIGRFSHPFDFANFDPNGDSVCGGEALCAASWLAPTGLAVLTAWVALCGLGLARPEKGAIDRLGRVAGILWIAFYLRVVFANF